MLASAFDVASLSRNIGSVFCVVFAAREQIDAEACQLRLDPGRRGEAKGYGTAGFIRAYHRIETEALNLNLSTYGGANAFGSGICSFLSLLRRLYRECAFAGIVEL